MTLSTFHRDNDNAFSQAGMVPMRKPVLQNKDLGTPRPWCVMSCKNSSLMCILLTDRVLPCTVAEKP